MPWNIPPFAIVEATIRAMHYGQRVLSVFHYRRDSGTTELDGPTALNQLNSLFNGNGGVVNNWANCVSGEVGIDQVVLQVIWPIRYRRYIYDPFLDVGQIAGPSLPPNVSAAITKRGDAANRHNIGTLHVPGVPRTFEEEGFTSVVGAQAYDALAQAIPIPLGDQPFVPVLLYKGSPGTSQTITTATAQDTIRVHRRRTVGVGE